RRRKGVLIHLALALGILAAYSKPADYSWPHRVFLAICVAGGIAVTGWIFRRLITASPMAKVSSDDLFLCFWLAGMLVACLAVFLGGSARYLLPACPVLLLLFLRIDERLNGSRSWMFYGSWLTAQLIFGLCLAQADYQFAGAGRREAYDFQRDYLRNHQPFLFNGEWAFRYYMTAIGGEIMPRTQSDFQNSGCVTEIPVCPQISSGRQRFLMGLFFGADFFGKFQFCRRFFDETRLRLFRNQFDIPIEVQAGTGRNEAPHDDVFFQTAQVIDLSAD